MASPAWVECRFGLARFEQLGSTRISHSHEPIRLVRLQRTVQGLVICFRLWLQEKILPIDTDFCKTLKGKNFFIFFMNLCFAQVPFKKFLRTIIFHALSYLQRLRVWTWWFLTIYRAIQISWLDFEQLRLGRKPYHAHYGLHLKDSFFCSLLDQHQFQVCLVLERQNSSKTHNEACHE